MMKGPSSSSVWTCSMCTYINESEEINERCDMCGSSYSSSSRPKVMIDVISALSSSTDPSMTSRRTLNKLKNQQKSRLQSSSNSIPTNNSVIDNNNNNNNNQSRKDKEEYHQLVDTKKRISLSTVPSHASKRHKLVSPQEDIIIDSDDDDVVEIISPPPKPIQDVKYADSKKKVLSHKPKHTFDIPKKSQTTLFGTIIPTNHLTKSKVTNKIRTTHKNNDDNNSNQTSKKRHSYTTKNNSHVTTNTNHRANSNNSVENNYKKKQITEKERLELYRQMKLKQNDVLKQIFQIDTLRNLQPTAVDCALRGKSQIIIMATGGGKSLCYQLPAALYFQLSQKITIVISPLIALMMDQVQSLQKTSSNTNNNNNAMTMEAACICSANGAKANAEIMQRLTNHPNTITTSHNTNVNADNNNQSDAEMSKQEKPKSPIQLLYCTPELIGTTRFRTVLTKLYQRDQLAMFAIDEAHCLSTWGHDFRPAYRELTWARTTFPDIPFMACTATATPKVVDDIRDVLKLGKDIPCHMSTFNRSNISYEVRYKDSLDNSNKTSAILNLMGTIVNEHKQAKKENRPCSGIIYVHKRNDTNMLVNQIQMMGISAAPYHAGLKDKERKEIQEKWTRGEIKVAVATVAFGMGIDLPHVRYVVHWSIAKTLEGFYQESGRGGRDGKPSKSITYYAKSDESLFAFLIKKNNEKKEQKNQKYNQQKKSSRSQEDPNLVALQRMVDYCKQAGCRRKFLLQHFGEKIDPKEVCRGTCDYCKNPSLVEKAIQGLYASIAANHVKKQGIFLRNSKSSSSGNWDGPHGEVPDDGLINQWDGMIDAGNGQLGITKNSSSIDCFENDKDSKLKLRGGFITANETLAKYEAMECQVGKKNGFVTFKAKGTTASIRKKLLGNEKDFQDEEKQPSRNFVGIPQHLRNKLPDPLQSLSQKKAKDASPEKKDSTQISSEIERLKADLAALKKKRENLGNRKSEITVGSSKVATRTNDNPPPPPPPPLSFRRRRKK